MLLLILLVAFIYLLYIRKCPVTVARVWFCASILLVVLVNWILCAPLRIAAHKKWMQRRLSERASCVLSGVLLGKVLWLLSPHIRVRFMEGSLDWRGIETVGAICAPHTSFYDTLFFLALCPLSYLSNCKAFAKRALWKLPLLGGVIRSCGHFPVYFTSQEQNSFSVDKEKQERVTDEADKFLADGGVICFFPEGALNHTPEKLKDFRLGTFKMVLKHQLPLHYMVYYGCQEVWDPVMKGIPGFPADVFVYIGKYEYNKGASAVEVANGMREEMQTRLDSMIEKRKSEHYMPPIRKYLIKH